MDESMQSNKELSKIEKQIIDYFIFLPAIRLALNHDRKIIVASNSKFKEEYIKYIDEAIHRVVAAMRKNKDDIFDHHIRMTRKSWFEYDVYIRGQLIHVKYHKSVAAEWIYNQIDSYLK